MLHMLLLFIFKITISMPQSFIEVIIKKGSFLTPPPSPHFLAPTENDF